ncbi:hypothetical protein TSUD_144680 [Trifolium subterraneum]|uniref:RNase H type-1 domain-containing protein n=1 Tax=Trifolium subterraneum TaxID=3900 RepID=A0A2Z6NLF6_TRISU|nr:hypothetical protein TSUD_144680 [Trifolium subterraneum]
MADVDASNTSREKGSQQTEPTQTNVASPRESRGPENGGIVSTVRGHIPPLRPAAVTQSSSIQGSFIEAPVVSLISNRPLLAITNDNTTTTQLTTTPTLNEGNQLDPDDMDTQVEKKRRMTASLVAEGSEVRTHQHFLSAGPAIDVEGRSGGLAVFWKDSSKCRVLNYTRNFINMLVEDEQWDEWRLTCYYGNPERSRRRAAWDLLQVLGDMSSIPWCIIGYFNDLLSQADKKGIHPHPNGLCMGFRQAVSDCDLTDIPIEGHPFTWIKSQDHSPILLQWFGGRENLEVVDRVTRCANKLQRWGKTKRIRFKEEIDECVRRMNELRGNQDEEGSMHYQELSERHATLLIQEEGYWKQRAKMHRLQEGDMNTRFFHMSATVRSKKKKVTKLIADNGTEAHTQEELCEVAKSYFDTPFKPRDGDHDPVLNLIQPRVTDDDNVILTAPITKVEIQQALFQMHPDKSPGPDGFNPAFYQRFWEQCCDDIFSAASTWLERGYFPTMLANRLKCCLDKCVSQEQSAFVEGELALKIDISKAYDKVDWGFLRRVMTKMGGSLMSGFECLTALIHQAVGRGDLHGVWICRGAPEVSHLLFADDRFLFCRANVAEVAKEDLSRILGVKLVLGTAIYLGLPSMVGRSEKAIFSYIKDRIWRRINSWRGRALSKAGKEIMIKSVLQAIPSYVMSGGLGVGIIFVLCMTLGCVGVLIDGCPRLNQQDVAEKILETPLVSSVCEDKVVWEEERNGCYSVKSGYKLAMRYIIDEEIEDELHIFFRCAVARDSWSAAGLSSVLHNATYQQTNAMDRIFAVCSNESRDTVDRVAMLLWCIWYNRNDKLWNDNVQMPHQIGRHAFDAWNDWYSVHKLQSNYVSGTTEADLVRWEKPALDWVKCNVDVAFVSGSGRTSVGLCFRDNIGHFMAGMTQWQQTVISSVEGEAWALLLTMEEARHRGLDRVQFESDSKVLIEAIHMQRRGNSEFLSIVHDILILMSSFINFEVKFVRRQANLVAHTLARAANSWASFHRYENIPVCIEHLVFNEMQ